MNITVKFLSTPSARRATFAFQLAPIGGNISIHALREEGDAVSSDDGVVAVGISIHALREEGDPQRAAISDCWKHFYPRPPRGGRLLLRKITGNTDSISIHALREEGDT